MRRSSQTLSMDGPTADPIVLRKSAQNLLDAIDRMMWALQNMPDGDGLRNSLVRCKSELGHSLESIGYTLKVRPGFKTVVTKIRQPRQDASMKYHPPQGADLPQQEMSMAAQAATRIIISSENLRPSRDAG